VNYASVIQETFTIYATILLVSRVQTQPETTILPSPLTQHSLSLYCDKEERTVRGFPTATYIHLP